VNQSSEQIIINSERLKQDFEALAEIGITAGGGVHRPALSEADLQARRWFQGRALSSGLEARVDPAGNVSAYLPCAAPGAPALLLGSHLDSVPDGGRFDGALGVLAALEVLRVVKEWGITLPVNLEAIDFTDEEGTLVGLLGSSALAGRLTPNDLLSPRGGRDALLEGLDRAGLSEAGLLEARRPPAALAGYLELHIEQGPRLWRAGVQLGVVTAIVGIASYELTYTGRADHAGTTPMDERADAALGAAAFTLATRRLVTEAFPECVANVGRLALAPGAFNIVPAEARLALECRAPEAAAFERLKAALTALARTEADRFGLGLKIETLGEHAPAPLSPAAKGAIIEAAEALGLSYLPLASGAGHDAQSLAGICPAGMLFIPSVAGASHSPREFSEWVDCENGAQALLGAALRLAASL
jgi:N-carbamoyl-L-amino-acid hydrolase